MSDQPLSLRRTADPTQDASKQTVALVARGRVHLARRRPFWDQQAFDETMGVLVSLLRHEIEAGINSFDREKNYGNLTSDQRELARACLYLAANARVRGGKPMGKKVSSLDLLMEREARLWWYDTLPLRLTLGLGYRWRNGALQQLYANLNHHNSSIRALVIEYGWIARARLQGTSAAGPLLENVENAHAYDDDALALLLSLAGNEIRFWKMVDAYGPTPQRASGFKDRVSHAKNPFDPLYSYLLMPQQLLGVEEAARQRVQHAVELVRQARLISDD